MTPLILLLEAWRDFLERAGAETHLAVAGEGCDRIARVHDVLTAADLEQGAHG